MGDGRMNPDPLYFEELVPTQSAGSGGRLTTRMFLTTPKLVTVRSSSKVVLLALGVGALVGFVAGWVAR